MDDFRSPILIKVTLGLFLTFLLDNPVLAGDSNSIDNTLFLAMDKHSIPVFQVASDDPDQLAESLEKQGYQVKEASYKDLQYLLASNTLPETVNENQNPASNSPDPLSQQECEKLKKQLENQKNDPGNPPISPNKKIQYENECGKYFNTTDKVERQTPPAQPGAEPQSEVQVHTGVYADISHSTGGSNSDAAKILFIFVGLVFVAAFVIYAGKYITDMLRGDEQKYWWEFVFDGKFLDTDPGEHGKFTGIKISTGPVSSELLQLALILEFGNADLDLIMNKPENPQPLELTATYWMLGGTIRLHLSDKLVNPSYMYIELLGGSTSNSDTDLIGMAKGGFNFGIEKNMRLGFSIGSQYIGLNEDKGFTNDGDNFWFSYGLELGVRF